MKRVICCILALLLVVSLMPATLTVSAAQKQEKTHAIGIVFDNSGSMYLGGNMAWCQATYAMEVFGSMLNEGDTMLVYPMADVEVDGMTYTADRPLTISGPGEADIVQRMYTPEAQGTPIETITAAYNGLQTVSADEKWLIVLTDGATFFEDERELSYAATVERLSEVLTQCNQGMNVLYLGVGSNVAMPSVSGGKYQFYAGKASNSKDVLARLTYMCNMIFGRNELPAAQNALTIDVSVSKLILFVQGSNVANVTLRDASGQNMSGPASQDSPKFSEMGCGNYPSTVDNSLQGVIATYLDCPAGTYTLGYDGNVSSIGVYYEPDVDARVFLTDASGNPVDMTGDIYSGVYQLRFGMVDKNNQPTESALLGQTNYTLHYTINGEEQTVQSSSAGTIDLELGVDDVLDGDLTVTYLNGYTIYKDLDEFGWPLQVTPRPAGELAVDLTGGVAEYDLSKLEDEGQYLVKLYYEGEQLTGDGLAAAGIDVTLDGGNVRYETAVEHDGIRLNLKYNGTAQDTVCGAYQLQVTANYVNQDGQTGTSPAVSTAFTLHDDSHGIQVQIKCPQSYYVISKLDSGEPVQVEITNDGVPMTAEELAAVDLTVDTGGLPYELTALPEESAFEIKLLNQGKLSAGRYQIHCQAAALDPFGQPVSAEDTAAVELQDYPLWLRYVAVSLFLLLILTLLSLFLNAKVLPKKIGLGKCTFVVDGSIVPGTPSCVYVGGKKKRGSLEVISPKYAVNPSVKCGFRLDLEAESPRRMKSASRVVRVKAISPMNPSTTTSVHVGSVNLIKDPVTGKLIRSGAKANAPIDFTISNNAKTSITAEVLDVVDGNDLAVSMSVPLKFY